MIPALTLLLLAGPVVNESRLEEERKRFRADAVVVEADHDRRHGEIIDRYRAGLESLLESYARAKNLEAVVLVRDELARIEKAPGDPIRIPDGAPRTLQKLQENTRDSVDRLEQSRADGMVAELRAYGKRLEKLKDDLTRALEVDTALEVGLEEVRVRTGAALETVVRPLRAWPSDLRKGLVLWLDLERDSPGSVRDRSRRLNTVKVEGAVPGADGAGLSFSGKTDRVDLGPAVKGFPLDDFTLAVRYRADGPGTLIGSGEQRGYPMSWKLDPRHFAWSWKSNRRSWKGVTTFRLDIPPPGPGWHHLMILRKGTRLAARLDGVEVARSGECPGGKFPVYGYGLMVGNMKRDKGKHLNFDPFRGDIAHVMIWDRALTGDEAAFAARLAQPR